MKWYGLNISKFCGLVVKTDNPDTPVVNEPIFLAHIPAVRKLFTVSSNRYILEQFNIKPLGNNRTFKVTQNTSNIERYTAVFNRNNREFKVIQN